MGSSNTQAPACGRTLAPAPGPYHHINSKPGSFPSSLRLFISDCTRSLSCSPPESFIMWFTELFRYPWCCGSTWVSASSSNYEWADNRTHCLQMEVRVLMHQKATNLQNVFQIWVRKRIKLKKRLSSLRNKMYRTDPGTNYVLHYQIM